LLETDGTVVNDLLAPLIKQKYVAIILPYVTKLKNEALSKILAPGFRLAENGEKVSGFSHGGVTPFGSLTPLPVIISRQTASENYIWLGGGLVDTKLRIFVKQLLQVGGSGVEGYKPVVADVAQPRVGDDADI
jgi:prolyl-tRNA editing enzyme YbaK/EbsC (Cys-tRNA(Pro) deacylase)